MKRTICLWLMGLVVGLQLSAQKGLHIAPLFNGQFRDDKGTTEVLMKGRKLAPYKLTLFRSLTLSIAHANVAQIERLVQADGATAVDKESGRRDGRLYYGFYQLKPARQTRRYLFYRNNALRPGNGRTGTLTLIYMEGTATIEELRRTFGQ